MLDTKLDILPKEEKEIYFIYSQEDLESKDCCKYEYTLTKNSFLSDIVLFQGLEYILLCQ